MNRRPTFWMQGLNTLSLDAPAARRVSVAGSFNSWSTTSHPMQRTSGDTWVLTLDLPPGEYEYKFLVDGGWCCMPGCGKTCDARCEACVPNAYGTMNRILRVADHRVEAAPLSVSRPGCSDRTGAGIRTE